MKEPTIFSYDRNATKIKLSKREKGRDREEREKQFNDHLKIDWIVLET